jgi:histidinol-phosphate aminotransferase
MSRAAPLSSLREDVRALHAYPVASSEGLIKLDAMENPYSLPPEMARRLGEHLGHVPLNRYPPGDLSELRRRLGGRVGLPDDCALLLGNGSDELIHLVIQACARPGAVVLAPWPSFSMYRMSAVLDGCRFVDVALAPDFSLDLPALLSAMARHQPAVVFLAYPNNPTGNLFDRTAIEKVLEAAPGLVVIDEAYLPFAQRTWIDELAARPGLLVLRTLSKLGLAGLRLGYLCGAPELIEQIDKVRPPYNVNVLTLAAVDFLLDHFGVLDNQAATLRADRDRLVADLRATAGVQVFETAANFVLLRVANGPETFAKLLQRGILVKDVAGMHPLLHNCLRVTVGTAEENALFVLALRASLSY